MYFDDIELSPYLGDEPFIFLSYSHLDKEAAAGIISRLNKDGYRIWYDTGIVGGKEWSAEIAKRIEQCKCFISLISNSYIESQNCRNELLYAMNKKKSCLPIYLEETELPHGLDLQLISIRALYKDNYKSQDAFFADIYSSNEFEACHGADSVIPATHNPEKLEDRVIKSPDTRKSMKVPILVVVFLCLIGFVLGVCKLMFSTKTINYPNGNVYIGQVKNDKRNGRGTMTYDNGTIYEGEWIEDLRSGQGTQSYSNGGSYSGEWKNDMPDGKGVYTYPNGDTLECTWTENKLNGKGIMRYSNGTSKIGVWEDNEFVGWIS